MNRHSVLSCTPEDPLQEVLDSASPGDEIRLSEGTFRAKISVRVPDITIRGEGMKKTRIVWSDYAKKLDVNGVEFNTFRTWTMAVLADRVRMADLSVVNDSGHPEKKGQEVALTVYADGFQMEKCALSSTQDTLFLGPLPKDLIARYDGFLSDPLRQDIRCRQFFSDCLIEGTVDFIFGCGEASFNHCELRSLADVRDIGYVAAPAHAPEQDQGFLFRGCRFTCEESVTPGSIYLARPWRNYGLCVFENCSYGAHISPSGFDKWNDTNRDRTARFYEMPPVPGRVSWVRNLKHQKGQIGER